MKASTSALFFGLALLAAPLAGGVGMAHAQGLGPDSDGQPIDITADQLEVQNKACISTWRGKAEALQGSARLRADVIRATMATKAGASSGVGTGACGDLIKIEAEGNVYYVTTKDQRVRGDVGVYDAANETVTLTGDVVAVQGQNVMRGTKMVFNSKTGEGRMVGAAQGRNAQGRPRGVFYPSKKSETASK